MSDDYNYYQQFDMYVAGDFKSTVRSRVKWHIWDRWVFWWTYRRGEKVSAYRSWWRERP